MKQFGITHDDYERLLKLQNGVCKICKKFKLQSNKNHMAIDHCHKSGKIRGILCGDCNKSLGGFFDNINYLKRAIKYLKGEL